MTRQFVTFWVNERLLGLDILLVREIDRQLECTPVELALPFYVGLTNLRGQIVTIIDLGRRLSAAPARVPVERHDIILKTEAELDGVRARERRSDLGTSRDAVGLRVDEIGDIVEVSHEAIEPLPANLVGIDPHFVAGVVSIPQGLMLLLDAGGLLGMD